MPISRRAALFLLGVAAWTTFIWVVLIRNVSRDPLHGTEFKVVHYTLAAISLALAAGTAYVGWRALRAAPVRQDTAVATVPEREDTTAPSR